MQDPRDTILTALDWYEEDRTEERKYDRRWSDTIGPDYVGVNYDLLMADIDFAREWTRRQRWDATGLWIAVLGCCLFWGGVVIAILRAVH